MNSLPIRPAEHLWPLANTALVNRHFATIADLEEAHTSARPQALGLPPAPPPTPPAATHSRAGRSVATGVQGMLWVMTNGTSWRQMPPAFGPWQTSYSRFQRWKREGLWEHIRLILLS